MEKQSLDSEEYKLGLRYEVLDECITNEMAWHGARLHEAGDGSEQGRKHSEAMMALVKLSESICVNNESIERGRRILNEMKAKRQAGDIGAIAVSVIPESAVA